MRRQIRNHFLLLEVVASLGLFSFFAAGLMTPYAKARLGLRSFRQELELRRQAQLFAIDLHCPGQILKYLPDWSSSEAQALNGYEWYYDSVDNQQEDGAEPKWTLRMSCDGQTPIKPDSNHPAWRRLVNVYWLYEKKLVWQQTFIALSSKPSSLLEDDKILPDSKRG